MEEKHSIDSAFLLNLKKGDTYAIRAVYEQAYPLCSNLILSNNGTKEDAKDIFQEALFVLIQKLKNPDFQLTAHIKTYMYAIVRNLWLKKLREDEKKGFVLLVDEADVNFQISVDDELDNDHIIEKDDKHEAVEAAFKELGEECKKIIIAYYYQKLSLKEIAADLDYTDNFIKVKKKRCMDTLKEKAFENQLKKQ